MTESVTSMINWVFSSPFIKSSEGGFEDVNEHYTNYGIKNPYFLSRLLGYSLIFFFIVFLSIFVMFVAAIFLCCLKDNRLFLYLGNNLGTWVFLNWFIRYWQVIFFDLLITALWNIKIYLNGKHAWSLWI